MLILGIETSCDETSAGVVDGSCRVLANVVATQIDLHARYGGIVPEVASRQHVLDIRPTVQQAMAVAGAGWSDIDAIAVAHGPGLAGSLITGLNFAKGLAAATGKPLVGVNHLEGHVAAAWAATGASGESGQQTLDGVLDSGSRLMCLIVSGGHTELVLMRGHGSFEPIGETRDDAAGEAFDKAARVLGLRYPGGPEVQRVAEGAPETEPLPRAWLAGSDEFSFSGLKTAVINRARSEGLYPAPETEPDPLKVAAIARAFQESVVDVLVTKTLDAADRHGCGAVVVAGGVAANRPLRETFASRAALPVIIPPVTLCTDNGAMIAISGLKRFLAGRIDGWSLDVEPGLRIGAA